MQASEEDIELFNDSLDRCIADAGFLDAFYDTFIEASPEVAILFAATPMKRQKRLLKASLFTAMLAADDNGPALDQLRQLAERHQELKIPPRLYDLWLDSLLSAAGKSLGELDAGTETAWRHILGLAIDVVRGDAV